MSFKEIVSSDSTIIDPNKWYHVAFTYTDNDVKLYLDNVLVGSNASSISPNVSSSTSNYLLGKEDSLYLNGCMDEIKFYNRVLNSNEIEYAANSNNNPYFLTNGLEGNWEFNEHVTTPIRFVDTSSKANSGIPMNNPTYDNGFIKGSKSLCFDSNLEQHVSIPGDKYIDMNSSEFSVTAWMNKSSDMTGENPIMSKDGVFDFRLSNGELKLSMHNGTQLVTPDPSTFQRNEHVPEERGQYQFQNY